MFFMLCLYVLLKQFCICCLESSCVRLSDRSHLQTGMLEEHGRHSAGNGGAETTRGQPGLLRPPHLQVTVAGEGVGNGSG